MGKWMSAVRIASTSGIALFCSTQLLPQDPGYEVSTGQTEPVEELPRFVLGGRMDVLTIESRYRILSCCLDYAPLVEVTGNVVRVTERDLGPACDCADVGWDLQVEVRGLPPADYEVFIDDQAGGLIASALVTVPASETALFVRGRVNGDSAVDISDAVAALDHLFLGGEGPACLDAADIDDDGVRDISDPIHLLAYLFGGGPPPAAPYPDEAEDPTPDSTACSLENSVTTADFIRTADVDGSGDVSLSDAVFLLNYLTLGGPPPACADAADVNDDGVLSPEDALFICCSPTPLWIGGLDPRPPRECGPDPTPDRLGCEQSTCSD